MASHTKNLKGQHSNYNPSEPYDFPNGKCSEEITGVDRFKILEGDAMNPDDSFPMPVKGGDASGKKSY